MYEQIEIGGPDAVDFLQGQLTQDVTKLAAAPSLPAAWCNPKGRVVTRLRLLALDDGIGLVVPRSLADAIVKRLSMYRLRAKVQIERTAADWRGLAFAADEALAALAGAGLQPAAGGTCRRDGLIAIDYSAAERFVEVFGAADAWAAAGLETEDALPELEWMRMHIRAGSAQITADSSEKYTPHMLNLDRLGAISFRKGCYTGQEIVARTENLGESKRRLMRYRADSGSLAVGDSLSDGSREVGTVVNVAGRDLLAVTPVAMHDLSLSRDGTVVTPVGLPYDL